MSTAAKKKSDAIDAALDAAEQAEPRDIKVHITCRLDSDIYMELKRRAESSGGKYQTLMNELLRTSLFLTEDLEAESARIVDEAKEILSSPLPRTLVATKLWSYLKSRKMLVGDLGEPETFRVPKDVKRVMNENPLMAKRVQPKATTKKRAK